MSFRLAKLRFRRVFKRRKRQLKDAGEQTDKHLERHFFRRLNHLWIVRRFVGVWVVAVLVLIGLVGWRTLALTSYFQHLAPTTGGVYREGVIGSFTNANPIYATSSVDQSVSSLIFAGLFKYNSQNQLVGDLAKVYSVSTDGLTYTVHLRSNLTWQDGKPLTADDVVFTYDLIQNPLAQSPLAASWEGVQVAATNKQTVIFTLTNPLASFKYSLTNGIVPKHLLASIPPGQLRSANFNTIDPIGAGPFAWRDLNVKGDEPQTRQELIALTPFAGYHAGAPKLGGFVIHAYPSEQPAAQALVSHDIDGLAGLDKMPVMLSKAKAVESYNLPLTAETMVFFKTMSPVLSDVNVRKALVLAADREQIVSHLPYKAQLEGEPLLPSQLGFNAKYDQANFDLSAAKTLLTKDGWKLGADGYLHKKSQTLGFDLYALDSPEFHQVANELKQQWRVLGIKVNVYFQTQDDFQNNLSAHNYDAVLHSISLGVDPDEYVYWDSSQADVRSATRLNLSEYSSAQADSALEAGRTRQLPALRAIKYQSFLAAWQKDAPALALYQPKFLYLTNRPLYNFGGSHTINSAIDRYDNVTNWEIRRTEFTD